MLTTLEKADKELFAVYQTIYSNSDTEMWYDFDARLNDTIWTDDSYWLTMDGNRLGGALILEKSLYFPFLIPPFQDRFFFWNQMHAHLLAKDVLPIGLHAMPDEDVPYAITLGYKVDRVRRMMARPTDVFDLSLDDRFEARHPHESDLPALAEVFFLGYQGGIDYDVFGESSLKECLDDVHLFNGIYSKTQSMDMSTIIIDRQSGKAIAGCVCGIDAERPKPFMCISDISVLPAYRGLGLAAYMLKRGMTLAAKRTPVACLCVTVGNPAENLYTKLGFMGGPRFSILKLAYGVGRST